jgi:hypothetical protein
MTKLTVASIVAAIASGATSVSGIARAHGVKGNPSGKVCKTVRELVPDVADRIKAAKSGVKVETPAPKVAKKAKVKASDKAKHFRNGSLIGVVFGIGATSKPRLLSEVIDEAAKSAEFTALRDKKTGQKLTIAKRRRRARWQYTMIASLAHPTNKGRVRSVETDLEGKPRGDRKLKDNAKLVQFESIAA